MGNQPGKDVSALTASDRSAQSPHGASLSPVPDYLPSASSSATYGQPPGDVSPSTGTYYSLASSGSPPLAPSSELTWSTPPSTPQMPRTAMGNPPQGQGHSSSASEIPRSRSGSRSQCFPVEEGAGCYNVHTGTMAPAGSVPGRPGSAGLPSDSSSVGSKRERRRFRVREPEPIQEGAEVGNIPGVRGKKDKSNQRKSSLNLPGPDGVLATRAQESDISSSSSDTQQRAAREATSPTGRHDNQGHAGSKGGLFHIGKGSSKKSSKSALGTLISQTAMLAPAVAKTATPSDLQASRQGHSLSHSDSQDSGSSNKYLEPQTPPPMDPTTNIKSVTPIFAPRHEPQGSSSGPGCLVSASQQHDTPSQATRFSPQHGYPMRRGASQELPRSQMSSPPPCVPAHLSGKMSPPPGVPLMGSQMLSKLPSQGGHGGSQHWDVSNSPHVLKSTGSTAQPQPQPQPQSSIRKPNSSSDVTKSKGGISGLKAPSTSQISSPLSKDAGSKPIASPKIVKTTTLKPLSETMKGLSSPYGTSPRSGEAKKAVQPRSTHQPKDVPLISQQQHQGVETVQVSTQQQALLKASSELHHQQELAKLQALREQQRALLKAQSQSATDLKHAPSSVIQEPTRDVASRQSFPQSQHGTRQTSGPQPQHASKQPASPRSQSSEQQTQDQEAQNITEQQAKSPQLEQGIKKPDSTDRDIRSPGAVQQSPKQLMPPAVSKASVGPPKTEVETSPQATFSTAKGSVLQTQTKQSLEQETAKAALDSTSKGKPGPIQRQQSGSNKTVVYKQKAMVTEVEAHPVAKVATPPIAQQGGQDSLTQPESAPEPGLEPATISTSDTIEVEKAVTAEALPTSVQVESSLPQLMPFSGTSPLQRSASAPIQKRGVIRPNVTCPQAIETTLKLEVLGPKVIHVREEPKDDTESPVCISVDPESVSDKDTFETPPTTPTGSLTSLSIDGDSPIILLDRSDVSPLVTPQHEGPVLLFNDQPLNDRDNIITAMAYSQQSPDDTETLSESDTSTEQSGSSETLPEESDEGCSSEQRVLADKLSDTETPVECGSSTQGSDYRESSPSDSDRDSDLHTVPTTEDPDTEEAEDLETSTPESDTTEPSPSDSTKSDSPDRAFREDPADSPSSESQVNDGGEEDGQDETVLGAKEQVEQSDEPGSGSGSEEPGRTITDAQDDTATVPESKDNDPDRERSPADDEEEEDEESAKYLVARGHGVGDKVAGWQKHFQHQQVSSQVQRQALLRERRGHVAWSSGDSIQDPASALSPISEDRGENRPEEGSGGEEGEGLSVAQRIHQMENRSEEDKFTLTRPTSGFNTPRLKVLRPLGSPLRGSFTPHRKHLEPISPLETDEQRLLDKLSHVADIAMVRDAAADRRKRFQQRRADDRRRTQPVTVEEIRAADSLESVNSFRAEVLRKSSFNVFEQSDELKQNTLPFKRSKGQEVFPQHVKVERLKERRKDNSRYKTLPVTQVELNQIPESETLSLPERQSGVKTLRQKLEEMERDSVEDVKSETPASIATADKKVKVTSGLGSQIAASEAKSVALGYKASVAQTAPQSADKSLTKSVVVKDLVKPVAQDTAKPVVKDIAKPVVKDIAKPVVKNIAKPVAKDIAKPVAKDISKPVAKDISKPVAKDISKPVAKDISKLVAKDISKPVAKDISKPVATDIAKPVAKDLGKPTAEDTTKPVARDGVKPVTKEVTKTVQAVKSETAAGLSKVHAPFTQQDTTVVPSKSVTTKDSTAKVKVTASGSTSKSPDSRAAMAAKISKLEVSDDELDKLVAINYQEISAKKKRQAQEQQTVVTVPANQKQGQSAAPQSQQTASKAADRPQEHTEVREKCQATKVGNLNKEPGSNQSVSKTQNQPAKKVEQKLDPAKQKVVTKAQSTGQNVPGAKVISQAAKRETETKQDQPKILKTQVKEATTETANQSDKPQSKSCDKQTEIPKQQSAGSSAQPKQQTKSKSVTDLNVLKDEAEDASRTAEDVPTSDTETAEDELSKLSVSEKLKLFKKLDKTASQDGDQTKHKRRFSDRRKRIQRANTMPVTGEEISSVANQETENQAASDAVDPPTAPTQQDVPFDKGKGAEPGQGVRRGSGSTQQREPRGNSGNLTTQVGNSGPNIKEVSKDGQKAAAVGAEMEAVVKETPQEAPPVEKQEDEPDPLAKLSLAEKVRMFSERKEEEQPQKREAAVLRRKNRRKQSRFKTQSTDEPITSEEVEKAARISPLAMSMVKPPDPDVLQTMSLKDQREYMAQWAESTLSDTGSRPGSRPSSMVLDDSEPATGGATRRVSVDENGKPKGILKPSDCPAADTVRGILKQAPSGSRPDREVKGILKPDSVQGATPTHSDSESERKPGILKREGPELDVVPDTDGKQPLGILKKDGSSPGSEDRAGDAHSILKRDSLQYDAPVDLTHGILKKDSPNVDPKQEIRGILKKDSSFEMKLEPEKGVLKKKDSSGLEPNMEELLHDSPAKRKDVNSNEKSSEDLGQDESARTPERGVLRKTSSFELKLEQPGTLSSTTDTSHHETPPLDSQKDEAADMPVTHRASNHHNHVGSDTPKKTLTNASSLESNSKVREWIKSAENLQKASKATYPRSGGLVRSRSARVAGRSGDSSTEEESSTSSEKMSWIKNDAIARRRLRKMEEEETSAARHSMSVELERKINGANSAEVNGLRTDSSSSNNHQPVNKTRSSPEKTTGDILSDPAVVKLRENKSNRPRPNSIAERLTMLQDSQGGWKNKVEEKDMSKFTIEGKLNMAGLSPLPDSPFMGRRQTSGRFPLKRAKSSPNLALKLSSSSDVTSETESDSQTPNRVRVHQPDEEGFLEFFGPSSDLDGQQVKVTEDDFNHVFIESEDILMSAKKIKPHRRKAHSRNPLKNLADRLDLQLEYEEIRSDVADRELRRIKREQIAGKANIAQEALAGLASKENFSKVSLRKTDSFNATTPGTGGHQPYRDVMLLQVKGRRHCQTRLVEPSAKSINSGDCFLLVTSDKVYIWIGDFSNVIERSRASELAATIHQKRDLGCKTTCEPIVITEAKQSLTPAGQRFWEILGGQGDYQQPGPTEEDELYEMYMAETTRVYGVKDDQLILVDSGYLPAHESLDSQLAFVFDFGSEMYVWTGKHVPFTDRKKTIKLAKGLWDKGYDYGDANINPLCPLCVESNGGLPTKADKRPDWALFGKVNENMETILFKEKFLDWPDTGRVIKLKGLDDDPDKKNDPAADLRPYDVSKMLPLDTSPITLLIEGSNVGRGLRWTEVYEGLRREYEVLTLSVEVFHILEYDHLKLDPTSHGQFHDGDTYVIRWNLMISQTGMRHIRTQEARHSLTGRERWAYFFWQGRHSTITEKGASALMTVELDEERGPQIRVPQGKEPPCFMQLFNGHMAIHNGKREDASTAPQGAWRLFIVRGEIAGESYLQEVACRTESLRSRSSLLLLNVKTGMLHVWHGAKSASHTRQRATDTANWLAESCPPEMGLHDNAKILVNEITEGSERSDFWVAMDTRARTYHCMTNDTAPQRHSPRVFYMHSVCAEFVAKEILNPTRNHDNLSSPFVCEQSALYGASQPGLFLVDNHHEVYLWQGWWPEETETTENVRTGSAESRFNVDRRLAIETTLNYCKEKNPSSPPKAWLVYAGVEPARFTNLFPVWETCCEATESSTKDGKKQDERTPLQELLQKLTCTLYTFAELLERPLPEGVDPLKLESYMHDAEFQEILSRTRDEFYSLPTWKQKKVKKDVGLY